MKHDCRDLSRRQFVQASALAAAGLLAGQAGAAAAASLAAEVEMLPKGGAPDPVPVPHFPDRLHAFVWRNWPLVPAGRMAAVVGSTRSQILELGASMGLGRQPAIPRDVQRRSYITVIRRNWHLLPYEQLLNLLGWTAEQLAFTLREDDFLYVKLGNLKPNCPPIRYRAPDAAARQRAGGIAQAVREHFPQGVCAVSDPLFGFVGRLSAPDPGAGKSRPAPFTPRFCYSYFALYGDPLLDTETDPYPDGYLARLADAGADGVWLQAVLHKLAAFPWDAKQSAHYAERLKNLRRLVARARKHGLGVWLYLNEPRAMPLGFFAARPEKKGVVEGDRAALCTTDPEVQQWIAASVATICRAVPDLAGFFSITASENLTNCWSHFNAKGCPRCSRRSAAEVIAEVNGLFREGSRRAGSGTRLIVWDWGWQDAWAPEAIRRLPADVALMSVSEWGLPIERGGIRSTVGEYSISSIGPGPRATRHWELARARGLKTIAKIQAGTTWELGAVPYIPAVENVARHAENLRGARLDGLMLGWSLGGCPSPNLEVVAEVCIAGASPDEAMQRVAERRFGPPLAPLVVSAWREFSTAFCEFPFNGSIVYCAPLHAGPANLLFEKPSGYKATMVGLPYDDLDGWRAIYPAPVFIGQMEKVAAGFEAALQKLRAGAQRLALTPKHREALDAELSVAEAVAIHYQSVANQARYVLACDAGRRGMKRPAAPPEVAAPATDMASLLRSEMELVRRLHRIQSRDSRIGFEASNHYFYVPSDLAEKVINCQWLLDHAESQD